MAQLGNARLGLDSWVRRSRAGCTVKAGDDDDTAGASGDSGERRHRRHHRREQRQGRLRRQGRSSGTGGSAGKGGSAGSSGAAGSAAGTGRQLRHGRHRRGGGRHGRHLGRWTERRGRHGQRAGRDLQSANGRARFDAVSELRGGSLRTISPARCACEAECCDASRGTVTATEPVQRLRLGRPTEGEYAGIQRNRLLRRLPTDYVAANDMTCDVGR